MKTLYSQRKKLNQYEIIGIETELKDMGIEDTFYNNESIVVDVNDLRIAAYLTEVNDLILTIFFDEKENENFRYNRSDDNFMQLDEDYNFIKYMDLDFLETYK